MQFEPGYAIVQHVILLQESQDIKRAYKKKQIDCPKQMFDLVI